MSAFRFRLARVLRVRRLQEEIARGEVVAARAAALAARAAADEVAAAQAQGRGELLDLLARPRLEPSGLVARHAVQDSLREARVEREARVVERERALDQRRAEARRSLTAVRGLERLEQRRRAQHRAGQEAAERAATDEVAQRRAAARPPRPASSPARRPSDESPMAPDGPTGPGPTPVAPR